MKRTEEDRGVWDGDQLERPVVKAVSFIPPTSGSGDCLIMPSAGTSASRKNPDKPTQVGFGYRNGRDAPVLEAHLTRSGTGKKWERPPVLGTKLMCGDTRPNVR